MSITKKEITITADAKTKVYGEVDAELTYQINSGALEFGDVLTGDLIREIGEDVGTYLIQIGTLSLGNNYNMLFVNANFVITSTLSIDYNILLNKIKLYPNPVRNFLQIEFSDQLVINEIVIYNLSGKEIIKEKNAIRKFKLNSLNAGTYLIKIITDQGIITKRILKD